MPSTGFAISPRNVHAEFDSPFADPHLVGMLRTAPQEDVVPPLRLSELADLAGFKRGDGVLRLSAREQVLRRRECYLCLDPAAA